MARSLEERLGITSAEMKLAEAAIGDELREVDFAQLEEDLRQQGDDLSATHMFERAQVIEACKADLNFLAPLAMPDAFEEDFPPVLLLVWQMVTDELI